MAYTVSNGTLNTLVYHTIFWRKFRVDNRKSIYFNHDIEVDNKRDLKQKISNDIC